MQKNNNKYLMRFKNKSKLKYKKVGVLPLWRVRPVSTRRLFPLSAWLITSANEMPTKEKVASREKSRLVENGLKV